MKEQTWSLATKARIFVERVHENQKYGEHPYTYHLDAVARILAGSRYFQNLKDGQDELLAAAYLHDVLEDTWVCMSDLTREFGAYVAILVYVVTDESGPNRKIRKERTNAKLKTTPTVLSSALVLKAADRLANLRESQITGDSRLKMYQREHEAFRNAAYFSGCHELWDEMEEILSS